ncbi:MAG: hypothetical protein M3327_14085 [Actinomycetota bacterium]|nr:hypothetical protein [Actinomycetota bacterium]
MGGARRRGRFVTARARRPGLERPADWIASVRLVAAPFVLLEVAIERGNYPDGDEPWAWALAVAFALGAIALFRFRERAAVALIWDTALVSGFVVLYGFEPSSPVRQLLVLLVVEAALRYGKAGAAWSVASAPALALFEWRASERLDVSYDPGHVLAPIGFQLLVGLIVGALAERARVR